MMKYMCLGLLFAGVGFASSGVQTSEPPRLRSVFTDDFSQDTRKDYGLAGVVGWSPGTLTLRNGADLIRLVNGYTWASVGLTLKEPGEEMPVTLRVGFVLQGATECYLQLTRDAAADGAWKAAVFDTTGEADEPPILVRETALTKSPAGRLRLEYRRGLITLHAGEDKLLRAFLENDKARVAALRISAVTGDAVFHSISVDATPVPTEYTAAVKAAWSETSAKTSEVVRLYRAGKHREALPLAAEVVEARRELRGPFTPAYAIALDNLAIQYRELGDWEQAFEFYSQELDVWRALVGEEHPTYNRVLVEVVMLNHKRARFTEAIQLAEHVYRCHLDALGREHERTLIALGNLAAMLHDGNEFTRAEECYSLVLKTRAAVDGTDSEAYAHCLSNFATMQMSVGHYREARSALKEALAAGEARFGLQSHEIVSRLSNLGLCEYYLGEYVSAEKRYTRAVAIARKHYGDDHPSYATIVDNLGSLYYQIGENEKAKEKFLEAEGIRRKRLGPTHPTYATSLNNLANLFRSEKDMERAEQLMRAAVQIEEARWGKRLHRGHAVKLHNLAGIQYRLGRLDDAERNHQKAAAIRKALLGVHHPEYANSLNGLARLKWKRGDLSGAQKSYRESLEIARNALGERHRFFGRTNYDLSLVLTAAGEKEEAESRMRIAADVFRESLNQNAPGQPQRLQWKQLWDDRVFFDRWLALALELERPAAELLEEVWRWKGSVTLRQRAYRHVAANPALSPVFDEFLDASRQLSVLARRAPIAPPERAPASARETFKARRDKWTTQFDELTARRERLERRIAAESEAFRGLTKPLNTAEFRKLLPKGTAFVDFLWWQHPTMTNAKHSSKTKWIPHFVAFVVTREQPPRVVQLGAASEIADAIEAFRRPLADFANQPVAEIPEEVIQQGHEAGQLLRRVVWEPVEAHLQNVDTVLISPDTELGTLPFAVLPGREKGTYLLERYRLASMPLAMMLRWFETEERRKAENGLLIVGDIDYDANGARPVEPDDDPPWARDAAVGATRRRWVSLPGFHDEFVLVRERFLNRYGDAITTLRQRAAVEEAFLRAAPKHHFLHLATHGFFADVEYASPRAAEPEADAGPPQAQLSMNPLIHRYQPGLLSGLVMAGANGLPTPENPTADGILTASEIEALDLQSVELVVLSACETGLGKTAGGDGLIGLQRAFHVAGARSCIATLWRVPDVASRELMSRFYHYYWEERLPRIDALRNAQLDLLRDPTLVLRGEPRERKPSAGKPLPARRTHPREWGAFQLSGEWR